MPPSSTWYSQLAHAADIMTIAVSVVDVISDIIVAYQFYEAGHMLWVWLVMASLVISNIVYACAFARVMDLYPSLRFMSSSRNGGLTMVFIFMLGLVIGQAVPLLLWYGETRDEKPSVNNAISDPLSRIKKKATKPVAAAVADEFEAVDSSVQLVTKMRKTIDDHMRTHWLFYVETVVESIPQAAVQLLAATYLGEVTSVQLFSMTLSLCSIISKAYLLSQASDIKVFALKFFMSAHDVFSLFYLCSSVIAVNREQEMGLPLLDDVLVSRFAGYLAWKDFVTVVWLLLLFVGYVLLATGLEVYKNQLSMTTIRQVFVAAVGIGIIALPAAIAFEGIKLLYLVALLSMLETADSEFALSVLLRTFVLNGTTRRERRNRLRHIVRRWATQQRRNVEYDIRIIENQRSRDKAFYREVIALCDTPEKFANDFSVLLYRTTDLHQNKRQFEDGGFPSIAWRAIRTTPPVNLLLLGIAAISGILVVTGALLSLAYPIVDGYLYFGRQNAFQRFCFIGVCVCLLGSLCLAPHAIRFVYYNMALGDVIHSCRGEQTTLFNWMAEYHSPSNTQILEAVLPPSLIPFDVCGRMGQFLAEDDVKKCELSIADCGRLRGERDAKQD